MLNFLMLQAQTKKNEDLIRKGNDLYFKQQYQQAAQEYNKAVEADPSDPVAKFNQANAFYKQDQKVEAAKIYSGIVEATDQKVMLSRSWYNKGVIHSQQKNLEESIESYKNALRNDPADREARENLQKALLELKKKPPPPKKEEQKKNKRQEQQKKQPESKLNPIDVQQKLDLLKQKEKEVQQRLQQEKNKVSGSQPKDW